MSTLACGFMNIFQTYFYYLTCLTHIYFLIQKWCHSFLNSCFQIVSCVSTFILKQNSPMFCSFFSSSDIHINKKYNKDIFIVKLSYQCSKKYVFLKKIVVKIYSTVMHGVSQCACYPSRFMFSYYSIVISMKLCRILCYSMTF